MRIRAFVGVSILAGVFAFPTLTVAQFQQPTSEELKMTADPKYPDAAAVILNLDDKTDSSQRPVSYHSRYMRIKILKESAMDLATVSLGYLRGYDEVAAVSGRTIHADGTIIPLSVKAADLLQAKKGEIERSESTRLNSSHERRSRMPSSA